MSTAELSTKPYLLRALYEWCVDNGYTPHIAVKVDSRAQVPEEFVRNGEITLNVSPTAVHKLQLGNEVIEFSARFAGVARQISVPVTNVSAIYARETGHGMTFEIDGPRSDLQSVAEAEPTTIVPPKDAHITALPAPSSTPSGPPDPVKPSGGGKPKLRRVK